MSQEEREKKGPEDILEMVEKKPDFVKTALDMIYKLFKEESLFIESTGYGIRINIDPASFNRLKKEFIEFNSLQFSDIRDVVSFVGHFLHLCREDFIDKYLELVTENKRDQLKSIIEEVASHECYNALAFRHLRDSNYLAGPIRYKTVTCNDEVTGKDILYYDISMLYASDEFNQKLIKLEMDSIEVEILLSRLAKIVKSSRSKEDG